VETIARQATATRARRAGHAPPKLDTDAVCTKATAVVMDEVRFNRLIIADHVVSLLRHAAQGGQEAIAQHMPGTIEFCGRTGPRSSQSQISTSSEYAVFPKHAHQCDSGIAA
jgi:hypothetical protein